jgi:hypothetical protein
MVELEDTTMENLIISGTEKTPTVNFDIDGHLQLKGRMLLENAAKTFEPIFAWVELLECEWIVFDIDLDYLNTSASMQLFKLMRILDETERFKGVIINWFYEEDDEDHLEMGCFYQDNLSNADFQFHMVSEERFVA